MAKVKYDNDFPSVTQVLGVLRKIGLENWFKFNTAKYCNEKSERGKIVGTQTHEAIDNCIKGKEVKIDTQYADEVTNALNSFILFRKENPNIELKFSELPLTSYEYQFNGTLDADIICNGVKTIGDWKTGECKQKYTKPPIYDEHKYQVAAYVKLFNEVLKQDRQEAVIVCFAKDKVAYNLYEMHNDEINACFNEVFLPALKIYNYQKGAKK